MKQAIIIYGQPGSGKGTQANLIQANFGFYHFDTGKFIERFVNDKENLKDSSIQKEKENFDSGKLCTPSWVLKILTEKISKLAAAEMDVVFSGSPRTLFETFGDNENIGLLKILERLYGCENIHFVYLTLTPESSIYRNSNRAICETCFAPVLYHVGTELTKCPACDSPVRKRSLDKPEIIKIRLQEYNGRTLPILAKLKEESFNVVEIDGEPAPYLVFKDIVSKLKLRND